MYCILHDKRGSLLTRPACDVGNNDRRDRGGQGKAPLTLNWQACKGSYQQSTWSHVLFLMCDTPFVLIGKLHLLGPDETRLQVLKNFLFETPTLRGLLV